MRWLLLLLIAAPVHAQRIIALQPVYIFSSAPSISASMAENLISEARLMAPQSGVLYNILPTRYIVDPCPQLNKLDTRVSRLYCLGQIAKRLRLAKPRQVTHFISPAMTGGPGDRNRYIAGYARRICGYRFGRNGMSYSYSNAVDFSMDGQSRFRYSLVALLHEVSHVIGASHDDNSANIMHSAANLLTNTYWPLSWNWLAKMQIANCVGGV